MKLKKIFPKKEFPLRAKTKVILSKKKTEVRIKFYYRDPALTLREQKSGAAISLSHDGRKVLFVAIVSKPGNVDELFYIRGSKGTYRRVTGEERLRKRAEAICRRRGLEGWIKDQSLGNLLDPVLLGAESLIWRQF